MKVTAFKKGNNWFAKVGRKVLERRFHSEQEALDAGKAALAEQLPSPGPAAPGSMINVY